MTDSEHAEILTLIERLKQAGYQTLDEEFHMQWYVDHDGNVAVSYDFIDTQGREYQLGKNLFESILNEFGFNQHRRVYDDMTVIIYYWGSVHNYSK